MESTISLVIVLSMIGILFICLHALSDESTPSDLQLGRIIRKPVLCIYMRKQRLSNCAAEQRRCFRYKDSTIILLTKSSSNLLWLCSSICNGPGQKPRRQVFSRRGSNSFLIISGLCQPLLSRPFYSDS